MLSSSPLKYILEYLALLYELLKRQIKITYKNDAKFHSLLRTHGYLKSLILHRLSPVVTVNILSLLLKHNVYYIMDVYYGCIIVSAN